jgi:hypothetical protein
VFVQTAFGGVWSEPLELAVRPVKAVRQYWEYDIGFLRVPRALALDADGNVYVTASGDSSFDYFTAKISADGAVVWEARYDGPGHSRDDPVAIALDAFGNVYVTGTAAINDRGTEQAFGTVKYDSDGAQLWERTYFGHGRTSLAGGLAVDAEGNAYVTGASWGSANVSPIDYATVKYAPNGDQLWVRRYGGPENNSAFAITLFQETNVIVAGDSGVVKYDADGNQIWVSSGAAGGWMPRVPFMPRSCTHRLVSHSPRRILLERNFGRGQFWAVSMG